MAAVDYKALGNAAFGAGEYQKADDLYAEALLQLQARSDALPSDFSTVHANRAAALLKLNRPAAALEEADNAVNKNLKWSKAHYRKGEAYRALGRWREASSCFFEAARRADNDPAIKSLAVSMQAKARLEEEKPAMKRLEEHIAATGTILNVPVTPTYSQFTDLVELGDGNYSQVFKAVFAPTKEVIALKVIEKKKAERLSMRHGNLRSELRAERRILSKLQHPNIIRLYTAFQDAANIYYVEEFCAGRELWYKLKIVPPVSLRKEWPMESRHWGLCGLKTTQYRFYLSQIVNALAYLRRQGIVHRDIKPENVMISTRPDDPRYEVLKLIDFGTARDTLDVFDDNVADDDKDDNQPPTQEDETETLYRGVPLGKRRPRSHFVGTAEFMSPEAVHGRPADHRSDLWSFGCLAFQLFTGRTPFKGASDYMTFLKAEARAFELPTYFRRDGPEAELLNSVLNVDPANRLQKAEQLKELSLFEGVDFDSLEAQDAYPRVPLPTLAEICAERLGEAIWIEAEALGEGPLSRRNAKSAPLAKKKQYEGEAERAAMNFSKLSSTLDDSSRMLVRRWLEQRSVLSSAAALRLLYGTTRGVSRVENHGYLGCSHSEEGQYTDPYIVAVIDAVADGAEEIKYALVKKLNDSKPAPKVVFVSCNSPADENLGFLRKLREDIPVIYVPSNDIVSDIKVPGLALTSTYVSIWQGGVLFLVVDAARLESDEAQQAWFDRELLLGKFCARYIVVLSNRRWFSKSFASIDEALSTDIDEPDMVPRAMREKFLRQMQESGVQLIVKTGGVAKPTKFVLTKSNPNEHNISQVETQAFPLRVRIVRCLPTDAVSDPYAVDELTGFFYLETGEIGSDDETDKNQDGRSRRRYSTDSSD